jgi:excisionase family DNA binding protein
MRSTPDTLNDAVCVFAFPPRNFESLYCFPLMKEKLQRVTSGLVRKRDIAEFLSVSVRTIEYWMADQRIPYVKVGKIVLFEPDKVRESIVGKNNVSNI